MKKSTKRQPLLTIRHSGAGVLLKGKAGLQLRLCSSAVEAEAAGLSAKRAALLFKARKGRLCETEFSQRKRKGFEDILEPYWVVYCVDTGCERSAKPPQLCNCNLMSTANDDPDKDPTPKDEGRDEVPVVEGRWYKCFCQCGFKD